MRRSVLIAVVTLLFAGCGGADLKAVFARYEKSVTPVLEKEKELRARHDEELRNIQAYGNEAAYSELVKTRLIPFYKDMKEKVARIEPGTDELRRIHMYLRQYVDARLRTFDLDEEALSATEQQAPIRDAIVAATDKRKEATQAFNKAVAAAPGVVNRLPQLFANERQAISTVFQYLDAMQATKIKAASVIKFIDEKVVPFYDTLAKQVDEMKLGVDGAAVALTAKAYVAATQKLVAAVRALAVSQGELMEPIQDKVLKYLNRAEGLLTDYETEAKEYRDSLR